MASFRAGGPDQATVAFRRLLVDATRDEQARVDALVVMSRRTVFAATWPGQRDAVRTLTNPQGQTAMPVFTGADTMGAAAVQFGWLNPDGSLDFREMGAREALRHALARGVHFLVVDLAAPSMVEFARGELEPLLQMPTPGQREPTGPFTHGGEPEAMFRNAVRESSKPPAGGHGSFIPPAAKVVVSVPHNPPPSGFDLAPPATEPHAETDALPPSMPVTSRSVESDQYASGLSLEPPFALPPAAVAPAKALDSEASHAEAFDAPGFEPSSPPPAMGPVFASAPPAAISQPAAAAVSHTEAASEAATDEGAARTSDAPSAADPGHDLGATAKQLAARVITGTDQARSLALRMAGRLGGAIQQASQRIAEVKSGASAPQVPTSDPEASGEVPRMPADEATTGTRPITQPPPKETSQTPSQAPSSIEDEVLDAVGGALRTYPEVEWACALPDEDGKGVIGLRVDPSFDARAEEIRAIATQTANKRGLSLRVSLLRTPDEMRQARREGTVFFPGRRRAVPRK